MFKTALALLQLVDFVLCVFCRQFVSLHEENNREYAIDKVFHLRTAAITLIEKNKNADFDSIASEIKPLLDMRNKIDSMPCPYLENEAKCKCYTDKLDVMSSALDAVAIAAAVRNEKALQVSLSALLANMNDFQNAALCCTDDDNYKVAELTTADIYNSVCMLQDNAWPFACFEWPIHFDTTSRVIS